MRHLFPLILIFGCADRPLPLGNGATNGSNGSNGGTNGSSNGGTNGSNGSNGGTNGSSNGTTNGSNGGTNGSSNGGTNGTPATARLLSPISTARLTTRRPLLRFDSTGTAGSPEVDLCPDRACSQVMATLAPMGDRATPTSDLPSGAVFWRVRTGAQISATWEFFVGKTAWNGAGGQGGFVLDLDGDGRADVAMTTSSGVQVNHGGSTTTLASPDGTKVNFGYVLAAAGDLDGDGYGDLAVGECSRDAKVNIWFGGPGFPQRTQAIGSPDGMDGFGCRLAAAGDLDADGYADLAVARVGQDFSGGLYVFAGAAGGVTKGTTRIDSPDYKPSRNGYSLAGVGDLDGDGYDDLVACEVDYSAMSGRAHVYRGGPTGISNSAVTTLLSPDTSGLQYGASVAGVGDVNGDGFPDFVVAAPASPMTSASPLAHLLLGGTISGDASGIVLSTNGATGFGSEVEAAGDLDGDGFADFAITSNSNLALFRGNAKGAQLASSVDALGQGTNPRHLSGGSDLDGDGFDDVIVVDGAGAEMFPSGDRARVKTLGAATGAVAH